MIYLELQNLFEAHKLIKCIFVSTFLVKMTVINMFGHLVDTQIYDYLLFCISITINPCFFAYLKL